MLFPGRIAKATVLWSNWCSDETELFLRIALPDDGGSLSLVPPGTPWCTGPARDGATLSVEPFALTDEGDIGRRTIEVQRAPHAIGVDAGSVWILGEDRLVRLDSEGRVEWAFALGRAHGALIGGGNDVAFGEGSVWIASASGSDGGPLGSTTGGVVRIDPEENRVTGTRIFTDRTPDAVVVHHGGVWLRTGDAITRLSTDDLRIEATIPIGSPIIDMAAGRKRLSLLVRAEQRFELVTISSTTNRVVSRLPLPGEPSGVLNVGTEWVTIKETGRVVRFDRDGRSQVFELFTSADGIALGSASYWVADFTEGTLARVFFGSPKVAARAAIGNEAGGWAIGVRAAWLVNYRDGTVTRIPI